MAISQEALGFMQARVAGDRGICALPRNLSRVCQFTQQGFSPARTHCAVFSTRAFQSTHLGFVPLRFSSACSAVFAVGKSGDGAGSPAVLPSGEWPENFSILNFEDLSKHYESVLFKEEAQPSTFLADVMSKTIYTARAEQQLEEIDHHFVHFTGLPVINDKLECIGVLSKKDKAKASNGLKSKVEEVMSHPAITLSADKTVSDAAVLMLKHKIHRIPIVNGSSQVVGLDVSIPKSREGRFQEFYKSLDLKEWQDDGTGKVYFNGKQYDRRDPKFIEERNAHFVEGIKSLSKKFNSRSSLVKALGRLRGNRSIIFQKDNDFYRPMDFTCNSELQNILASLGN